VLCDEACVACALLRCGQCVVLPSLFAALDLRTCVSLSRLGRMALRLRLLACLWGPHGQDWECGVPGVVFELLLAQCERLPPRKRWRRGGGRIQAAMAALLLWA
ncbi:hypothetical protein TraAM80_09591, partial [Trypanosoma rangeli]